MKILAIRLKNLASLAGEQAIDFTAEPLASAGLFAITGPTGAGKSTLLDALCLALFGSTPRLDGVSPLNKVPDGSDEIGGGDERNLLRRGCASGYAEVDFIGVDNRRYRARWEVKRAREKSDGRLQASNQSLLDLDSNQLLASGKKREFRELLEARLGLTLPQFTRAVLLAQSEFSAFLKADDNERGSLLEKLTDTGLYSRLGQAAFETAKHTREALAQLQQQAGGVQPMAPDARQALENRHDEQLSELKALQTQLKTLEMQRLWLTERARLQGERDTTQLQLQQAEDEHERLADARHLLGLFEQLAPQRHRFLRQTELPSLLTQIDATLTRQQIAHDTLQQRQDELEQLHQQAGVQLKVAEQARLAAEPALAVARREEERLRHLHADLAQLREENHQAASAVTAGTNGLGQLVDLHQRATTQLDELTHQLQASTSLQPLCASWNAYRPRLQQLVQLSARLRQGRDELPALEQRTQRAKQEEDTARKALDALQQQLGSEAELAEQLPRLHRQLDDWRLAEREHESLQQLWSQQHGLLAEQQALQAECARQQTELDSLTALGKQLRSERDTTEQALKLTLELLDRQRLARSESVEALRATLVPGEPCPVCGSGEHPWHQANALLASLAQQDDNEAQRARQALQAQDQRLQELRDRHTILNTLLRQGQQRQTTLGDDLQKLTQRLQVLPSHARLLQQPQAERPLWLEKQLDQLRSSIAEASQRQQTLLDLQQRSQNLRQVWQQAHDISREASQQLAQQHEALARDNQRLEEELAEFADLLPAEQLHHWRENPAQSFIELDAQVAVRLQHLEQQAEQAEQLRHYEEQLNAERREQVHRQEKQKACTARLAERENQLQTCQQALRSSLGDQPAADIWQQQLDSAIQHARQQQAEFERQLNDGRLELARLTSEQSNCRQRRGELQHERDKLDTELSSWRAAQPELNDATLAQLLRMDDNQLSETRQRLQHNTDTLTRCRERLEGCIERLSTHLSQQTGTPDDEVPDVETLQRRHAEQSQVCEDSERRCAETRALLLDDDNRRNQSQALLLQIDAAMAENQRWGRIAALIGSSDGGAFRKIAQAYNLDLLVQHANVQLRQLARRYRLQRGGSPLGLLVMDTEMGDERRSVHSLSGGETFLVSLALALGLASMASSKLKIESLFIDEGFGSLDPESLQIAMDALDSLQAQGRKVAVISHVAQMHERIPVQIQVQRMGNGQSGLRITDGAG